MPASPPGWNESQFIQSIVNDISENACLGDPIKIEDFVGDKIRDNCISIEILLKDFSVISIWGMGGVGKTTLAKVLFAKLTPQYDGVCFLENIREESKIHGLPYLRDKLLFDVLKEESPKSSVVESLKTRLKSKKVLIVLDDVDNLEQLEYLCGKDFDKGPYCKLIITTRERDLLAEDKSRRIYEVQKLNRAESLELFSLNAFNKIQPQKEFEDLSKRAVAYAGGIPLALKVLGSYLGPKSPKLWDSALRKLKAGNPKKEILTVLQVSYDGLDREEKAIFLDIALFFKGKTKDFVIRILDACGLHPDISLDALENKALITISSRKRIQMHDLLQELGAEMVHRECTSPEERSRLRDIEVSNVLKSNKGTKSIEGIKLDLSEIREDLELKAETFNAMTNLRILQFYVPWGKESGKVSLPEGLTAFSNQLRYFEWNGYPLKSLPQDFCAKFLVEILMPHSHVEELWKDCQDLEYLQKIDLSECEKLEELPDLSKAKTLRWVYLSGCKSLRYVPMALLSLDTLHTLMLDRCIGLKRLESMKPLKSLEKISVHGCTSLKVFSLSSPLFHRLNLSNTAVKRLHTSTGNLSNLRFLNLEGLRLDDFLEELCCLTSLQVLRMPNCTQVVKKQDIQVLFHSLRSLRKLFWRDCSTVSKLPKNIRELSELQELWLDGSNVESLPASIEHLDKLEILSLRGCRKLQHLPKLPPFISKLYAVNCTSLVTVSTLKTFAAQMKGEEKFISFMNAMKLDERSLQCIIEGSQLTMMSAIFHNLAIRSDMDYHSHNHNTVKVCFPGSQVPAQFTYHTTGSSMTIDLPTDSNSAGFILCAVLPQSHEMKQQGAKIFCRCFLASDNKIKIGYATRWYHEAITQLNSDHVCVWYDPFHCSNVLDSFERRVTFEFYVATDEDERDSLNISTKEVGVRLISKSEVHSFFQELDLEGESRLEFKSKLESELGFAINEGSRLKSRRAAILQEIEEYGEKESNSTNKE